MIRKLNVLIITLLLLLTTVMFAPIDLKVEANPGGGGDSGGLGLDYQFI